jgi:N12 class adenine-specific DNA methylase
MIATGSYDAIIMAHSQFEKIPLSKARQEQFIQNQLDELEYESAAESEKKDRDRNRFTVKQLEKRKKQLEAKLDELMNQDNKDDTIDFEELGIDKLFVDEAHFFKNLYYQTKLTNIAGLSKSESNRATDMFMKCRFLDEKTGNKGVCFATGTPVSNSLAEMYTMQRFLQFDTLEEHGLYSFDDWASSFGDIVTSYEIAPEGNGKYRERRRFAEFFNLPDVLCCKGSLKRLHYYNKATVRL